MLRIICLSLIICLNALSPLTGFAYIVGETIPTSTDTSRSCDCYLTHTTYASLQAQDLSDLTSGDIIYVQGREAEGDGGDGHFRYISGADPGTYTDNGGTILLPTAGDGSAAFLRIHGDTIHSDWFTLNADGITSDSTTVQAMVTAATNKRLVFSKYSGSILVSDISLSGDSIEIDLGGNTFDLASGDPMWEFTGGWSDTTGVSGLTTDTVDDFTRTVCTVSDASSFSVGDVVKVVSTDDIPNTWATNCKLGEFSEVIATTSTSITLNTYLYQHSTYANNIQIARLDKDRFKIYNGIIVNTGGYEANGVIIMTSAFRPVITGIDIYNAEGVGFKMVSDYKYHILDCSVTNSENDTGSGKYGYGANDVGSHLGLVENFTAHKCRHAFTTSSIESATADMTTGMAFGTRVVNGVGYDCEAGAWDTHPHAVHVSFIGCKAYGCLAFGQSRSAYTVYEHPVGRNLTYGIKFTSGTGGPSTLINQQVIDPNLSVSDTIFTNYLSATEQETDPTELTVSGGYLEIDDGPNRGCLLKSTSVPIELTFTGVTVMHKNISTDVLMHMNASTAAYDSLNIIGNTIILYSNDTTTTTALVRYDNDAGGDPYIMVANNIVSGPQIALFNAYVYYADAYVIGNRSPPAHAVFTEVYNGDLLAMEDVESPSHAIDYSTNAASVIFPTSASGLETGSLWNNSGTAAFAP